MFDLRLILGHIADFLGSWVELSGLRILGESVDVVDVVVDSVVE